MKLAFFYRQLDQGGIERIIVNCANYFVEHGHDVTIVLIKPEGFYLKLLHENVKVIYFKSISKTKLYSSFSEILKREKFDLLFSSTPALNTFSILAKILSGTKTKIVISEHNNTLVFFKNMKFTLSKFTYLSIPLLYRFADAIVAVSAGLGNSLQKVALLPLNKIRIIHNPAYSTLLDKQLEISVEHEWFNDKSIPVLVNAGRLTEAKNQALLIDAVHLLIKRRPVRLMIVGDGHLLPVLQNQINSLGLENVIQLVGFQINPVSWINQADVFVLSSDYEGFGVVLVEALAAGTTIVSTDCDYGPAEILIDKFGYLVPVGDKIGLADKIEFALNNPLQKTLLKDRAKEFSVDDIMLQYDNLFTELTTK